MVKELTSSLPQVPVICVPVSDGPAVYQLSLFSPTDVLEGKLRRARSTALFVALDELYFKHELGDVCQVPASNTGLRETLPYACEFFVSDSFLSQQNGKHYRVVSPMIINSKDPFLADPSSDEWYKHWWSQLGIGQEFRTSGQKANAEWLARDACDSYTKALKIDPLATQAPTMMPIPHCSVMVATAEAVYMVVDFPDFNSSSLTNYTEALPRVFGRVFSGMPYKGAIVFRSPWLTFDDGKVLRDDYSFDLLDLEFSWEETSSGVRAAPAFLVANAAGQVDPHVFSRGSSGGAITDVAALPDGRERVRLTSGSEWYVAANPDPKCRLTVGSALSASETFFLSLDAPFCRWNASFAGAW